jgi:uncharacterized protein
MINWAEFTPISALIGGLFIGIATAALILMNGRIAGISGILGSLFTPTKGDIAWRVAFLSGLILSSTAYAIIHPLPEVTIKANLITIVIAGLLVGYGTRLGSGCTSGHGICGVSRLSMRSITATVTFIAAGMITVFITKKLGI